MLIKLLCKAVECHDSLLLLLLGQMLVGVRGILVAADASTSEQFEWGQARLLRGQGRQGSLSHDSHSIVI